MLAAITYMLCAAVAATNAPAAAAPAPTNAVAKAERVRIRPRVVIPEAEPTSSTSDDVAQVEPAKPVKPVAVPETVVVKLAKMTAATVPEVLEAVLAGMTEADAPAIAAAVYSRLVELSVPGIKPVELAVVQAEWYERFKAISGSKAYWILQIAKERAKKGESVEQLRILFDKTMQDWLNEED